MHQRVRSIHFTEHICPLTYGGTVPNRQKQMRKQPREPHAHVPGEESSSQSIFSSDTPRPWRDHRIRTSHPPRAPTGSPRRPSSATASASATAHGSDENAPCATATATATETETATVTAPSHRSCAALVLTTTCFLLVARHRSCRTVAVGRAMSLAAYTIFRSNAIGIALRVALIRTCAMKTLDRSFRLTLRDSQLIENDRIRHQLYFLAASKFFTKCHENALVRLLYVPLSLRPVFFRNVFEHCVHLQHVIFFLLHQHHVLMERTHDSVSTDRKPALDAHFMCVCGEDRVPRDSHIQTCADSSSPRTPRRKYPPTCSLNFTAGTKRSCAATRSDSRAS